MEVARDPIRLHEPDGLRMRVPGKSSRNRVALKQTVGQPFSLGGLQPAKIRDFPAGRSTILSAHFVPPSPPRL